MSRKKYLRIQKRRRGTAIVETEKGIIVTAGRSKIFLLPGGGANKHETRMQAAMRELGEETGLQPYHAKYLFHHRGRVHKSHGHGYFRDHHTVCLIKAKGTPHPHHEIKYIAFYKLGSGINISGVTKEIIEKYYSYKKRSNVRQKQMSIVNRILEWFT
jgi:8-oxo-dGTP diphosphatase